MANDVQECPLQWLTVRVTDFRGTNEAWEGMLGFGAYELEHKVPGYGEWRRSRKIEQVVVWVNYVTSGDLRPTQMSRKKNDYEFEMTRLRAGIAVMDMQAMYSELMEIVHEVQGRIDALAK